MTSTTTNSASLRGCCCCLFLLFSFLILLTLTLTLITILALKPKKPQFNLQNVAVHYVDINTTTSSAAAAVSLDIIMMFEAVNGNKIGIKYRESRFTVMYRGIPLGRGSVPGFYQPDHSEKRVELAIVVDRVSLMQADAVDLVRDASLSDRVEFRVLGDVGAGIRVLGLTSPNVQLSVDCTIAISPRRQALVNKQCGFDGLTV